MARDSMDILELLRKRGMDGDVDFLREALAVLVEGIMDTEVSAKAGAGYGERSPDRVTQRNGYRNRSWDTRVGTMELRIPKLRDGATSRVCLSRGVGARRRCWRLYSRRMWRACPPGESTIW